MLIGESIIDLRLAHIGVKFDIKVIFYLHIKMDNNYSLLRVNEI